MNRPFFTAISLLLGTTLWQMNTLAQPKVPFDPKTLAPTFSVAELEQFLGGKTTLSLDLKDAPLEEVAKALSSSSGQKVEVRPERVIVRPAGTPVLEPLVPPLFTLSTPNMSFWEAIRAMQLSARRASEATNALDPKPSFSRRQVTNSVGLQKNAESWWGQADNTLADGRAVAAWPFLLVATDIRRSQEAKFGEESLQEIESRPPFVGGLPQSNKGKVTKALPATLKTPVPEEKRWADRLTLSGQIFVDPKLKPMNLSCEVLEAIDDRGNDLCLSKTDNTLNSSNGLIISRSRLGEPLRIALRSQPGMGKRLTKLRGEMRFSVVTRSQHFETTQLDKPIDGTIWQNGNEFQVLFEGLQHNDGN